MVTKQKTKNFEAMKTQNRTFSVKFFHILTALIIVFQMNTVFADNLPSGNSEVRTEITTPALSSLGPVTPKEADFSDTAPEIRNDFSNLAPETPKEADFEDAGLQIPEINLTPTLPAEADFSDQV
jgi:hypothetical protein